MKTLILLALTGPGFMLAQNTAPDQIMKAIQERAMASQIARLDTDERIRFYQTLVTHQPEHWRYHNLLALTHIQKTRESQDFAYLDRAARLIDEVLSRDPGNYEALRVRSQIYLERHEFRRAAENSARLIARDPDDSYNHGTLGDALLELGDYEKAANAYQKMVNLSPDLSSYHRASYYRYLFGDSTGAVELMKKAIDAGSPSVPENLAWCLVQLGDLYFKQGDLKQAEQTFEKALQVFPNHHDALAGMGKVAAARNRMDSAIDYMKRSVAIVPVLDHVALLSDYYELAGRKKEAREQWKLVEFIERLGSINQEVHNRNLAMVYLNRDWLPEKGLQLALRELEVRGDIYTWDAVAWAYYKNRKYTEAGQAMEKAMRLGTSDPALHYHAGMIARAGGNAEDAKRHLTRALALNPKFDLRQAPVAQQTLEEVTRETGTGGAQ